jgi:purine-binding chemotaxis protein CheW
MSADLFVLVVRINSQLCGFAIEHVIETMRPLEVDSLPGMPPFVRGLSVVRGSPVPVVELAVLLGEEAGLTRRWVLLRVGERRVAVAVTEVLGLHRIAESAFRAFPPLLEQTLAGLVLAVEQRDREFLLVLQSNRLMPEDAWRTLEQREVGA